MADRPAGPPFALHWPTGKVATAAACVKLLDDEEMPIFGLGVYKSPPGWQTESAVIWALQAGYRLIDTAAIYKNETCVGVGITKSGVPREEVFITTKLADADHGYDNAIAACERSLQKLGLDHIDLYLIHSPNTGLLVETWDALLELQRRGKVRSIGVSNFGIKHIEALQEHGRPLPVVNQIELHPMVWRERAVLLEFCKQKGIIVTAYGSIFAGQEQFLKDRTLVIIATECDKTAGQVLLRWGYQMGLAVIPKSLQQSRIIANMQIFDFELSAAQMEMLCRMRGDLGQYWNPLEADVDVGDTSGGQQKQQQQKQRQLQQLQQQQQQQKDDEEEEEEEGEKEENEEDDDALDKELEEEY